MVSIFDSNDNDLINSNATSSASYTFTATNTVTYKAYTSSDKVGPIK